MIENRRAFRIPFRRKVLVVSANQVLSGYAENLSSGGILVSCTRFLNSSDSACKVFFPLEEDLDPLIIDAHLKRIKSATNNPEIVPGMAMEFKNLSTDADSRIQKFMGRIHQNLKVVSAVLGAGEPDLMSVYDLTQHMFIPPYQDFGELRFYVDRVLDGIESVVSRSQTKSAT